MKRIYAILLAIIAFLMVGHAQNTNKSEFWSGIINVGVQKLSIGFEIKSSSDGKYTGTMDVPAQGVMNIPVEITQNNQDSLCITISALRATYGGRKVSSESIEGRFFQNGMNLPLYLKPG